MEMLKGGRPKTAVRWHDMQAKASFQSKEVYFSFTELSSVSGDVERWPDVPITPLAIDVEYVRRQHTTGRTGMPGRFGFRKWWKEGRRSVERSLRYFQ